MGGEEGGLGVGFAFGGEAEGDGHYFCFAEEESGGFLGQFAAFCGRWVFKGRQGEGGGYLLSDN